MLRTYRVSKGSAAYYVGFSLVWFGAIVGGVVVGELAKDWTAGRVAGILFLLLVAVAPAFITVFRPFEVTLDDEVCEFRSLLRRKQLRVQQIRSISADDDDLEIRHDRGTVRMVAIADFKDLLIRLLELNPATQVDGWIRGPLDAERAGRRG